MNKRFERSLSQILTILVLLVFLTTILSSSSNIWLITYIWSISFILAWLIMLVYGIYVLFEKESFGYSIFLAIISSIGFAILSIPAILVLSRFIPGLPQGLLFKSEYLNINSQQILYTSLIVSYFLHLINVIKLNRTIASELAFSESKDIEEDLDEEDELDLPKEDSISETFDTDTTEKYIDTEDDSEKIILESNIDKKEEYNTEEVVIVEDLTEDDLDFLESEDNNG